MSNDKALSHNLCESSARNLIRVQKYTFGKHIYAHYFCGTCGVSCMVQSVDPSLGPDIVGVNARTLHNVYLESLRVKTADGKRL